MVARKPLIGTIVENVLEHGTGGLNIDGCRIGAGEEIIQGGGTEKPITVDDLVLKQMEKDRLFNLTTKVASLPILFTMARMKS